MASAARGDVLVLSSSSSNYESSKVCSQQGKFPQRTKDEETETRL